MSQCDTAIVYYNPEKVKQKDLETLKDSEIKDAFNNQKTMVFTDESKLEQYLTSFSWQNMNLVLMSSGNFNGLNLSQLVQKLSI